MIHEPPKRWRVKVFNLLHALTFKLKQKINYKQLSTLWAIVNRWIMIVHTLVNQVTSVHFLSLFFSFFLSLFLSFNTPECMYIYMQYKCEWYSTLRFFFFFLLSLQIVRLTWLHFASALFLLSFLICKLDLNPNYW